MQLKRSDLIKATWLYLLLSCIGSGLIFYLWYNSTEQIPLVFNIIACCVFFFVFLQLTLILIDIVFNYIRCAEGEFRGIFYNFDSDSFFYRRDYKYKIKTKEGNIIRLQTLGIYRKLKGRNVKVYFSGLSKYIIRIEAID